MFADDAKIVNKVIDENNGRELQDFLTFISISLQWVFVSQGKPQPPTVMSNHSNIKVLDIVWSKLDGYPWWPGLVCVNPTDKVFLRHGQVHVQFFDDPPTRGWVRDIFVKPYGTPGESGIPTYKDPSWHKAVEEASMALELTPEDRKNLLVEMLPSDDEDLNMETDEEESDKSKENVDINISKISNKNSNDRKEPEKKRRRIILHSGSESEDEYKPGKDAEESDDSVSSGEEENELSEPETESEIDSPVKKNNKRKRASAGSSLKKANFSMDSPAPTKTPSSAPGTPKVSENTKSKLSLFAAKDVPAKPADSGESWPFMRYKWLQLENIRDREKRPPTHPDYNPRTLYVPEDFLNQQTPGMRQWWELKSRHYDTVLFFKMGKFYELFHMDATMGVQELGLLMMKGEQAHVGFPEIAYGRYSSTLIDKGYKVARIEQMETPDMMEKRCKNLNRPTKFDRVVRREVCQVTTKATRVYSVLDGEASDSSTVYLLALTERPIRGAGDESEFGVAFIDTSIGTFYLGQFADDRHASRLRTLMAHYPPAQVLVEKNRLSQKAQKVVNLAVPSNLCENLVSEKEFWTSNKTLNFLADGIYFKEEGQNSSLIWPEVLKELLDDNDNLGRTANPNYELAISALGALTWYLMDCKLEEELLTRKMFMRYHPVDSAARENLEKTAVPTFISGRHHMVLDGASLRNLEVFENSRGGTEGTLFQKLDHCLTPFGKRLLRKWICSPLCHPSSIESRLDAVEDLSKHSDIIEEITPLMKGLPDLERLLARIHSQGLNRSANHPDTRAIFFEDVKYNKKKVSDFLATINGFKTCVDIQRAFKGVADSLKSRLLKKCVSGSKADGDFPSLKKILKFFDTAFDHDEAKREGTIIPSSGVDSEYDEAVTQIKSTKDRLSDYLKEQSRYFGTKVVYWGNDKKRYQLEVPDHACRKANDNYELISQKKGFKRYWTDTTKELLADMISGEEHRDVALKDIARRIFSQFDQHQKAWESALQCISVLDVLMSLMCYSKDASTVRPSVFFPKEDSEPFVEIRDGLHPCVVTTFSGDEFIPNDLVVNSKSDDAHAALVLVTGPNMGGKSTLMRQTALICILAQMGSFVPAGSCQLTPIDRIFTRLGASDRIMMGESTFFVELAETSSIIQHATPHSLVLVDELGRGTATYDGTAIASAVVQALVKIKCRTLFSTHYHSLVDDFAHMENVSLGHMACMVEGENEDDPSQETITFLYKFIKGACPKSYGFNAARLADLPDSVIRKGSQKSREFEKISQKKQLFSDLLNCKNNIHKMIESLQKLVDVH
ncbi:DNA mismatch repair protein msh6 [Halocaridina rubra]|uniref:DNA mismatch repair protein n=1 Tax=Halocaridina rubra TaxID=373956 RepID=A0AAN9A952_HALRR